MASPCSSDSPRVDATSKRPACASDDGDEGEGRVEESVGGVVSSGSGCECGGRGGCGDDGGHLEDDDEPPC